MGPFSTPRFLLPGSTYRPLFSLVFKCCCNCSWDLSTENTVWKPFKPPRSNNFNAFDENQNYLGFAILAIYDYSIRDWRIFGDSNGHSWPFILSNGYRIRPGYIIMAKEHAGMTFQSLLNDFSGGQGQNWPLKFLGVNFRYVARNNELICDFEDFFKDPLKTPYIET